MQNLVSRKNDAIDVNALGIGLETVEHHGQSVIGLTEVASHLPIQHMKTDREQEEQLEVQVDDENSDNPKDWIYQVLEIEHECELETVVTPSVKGRLKEHITFWIKIGAPNFVLSVIQEGYKIPFIEIPPVAYLRNSMSTLRHKDFVQQAISELLQSKRVIKTNSMPHVVNPLSVSVQPSGRLRLILDLRHVNNYVRKHNIKYEDWKTALTYFHKGCFMISFDLKSGYHHIDIHPGSQTFLGFAWKKLKMNPSHIISLPFYRLVYQLHLRIYKMFETVRKVLEKPGYEYSFMPG